MEDINKILADVKQEGLNPFDELETETPTESLPETKQEEETPAEGDVPAEEKSEDNLPFHKHPRWIERENELNSLKEREEEMARELAELKSFREEKKTDDSIPDWFSELYGDNQVAYQKYSEHEARRTEEIEARILARQEEQRTQQTRESEHWQKWVDTEIDKLAAKGLSFDKNELIQTMLEYRPTDESNNFDFDAGFKIYEAMKGKPDTARSTARKQLADATTVTRNSEAPKKDYMTPAELRNRSWSSL